MWAVECDNSLSSVCLLPSLNFFSHFDLFSETIAWFSTKLEREHEPKVIYQVIHFSQIPMHRFTEWQLCIPFYLTWSKGHNCKAMVIVHTFKNWMLILVLLCENECQRWDASRCIKARSAFMYIVTRLISEMRRVTMHKSAQRFYVYRDASHLWHSFSHNRTKINIQNL